MADEVIVESRPLELWFPLGVIVSMATLVGMLTEPGVALTFLLFGVAAAVVTVAVYWWWWARNAVTATTEGIVANVRGREKLTYRWEQIETLGWEPGTWGLFLAGIPFGSRVLVYPTGGRYDMPGPNHPVRVGVVQPPLPWRRREVAASVSAHLDELLRRHRPNHEADDPQ